MNHFTFHVNQEIYILVDTLKKFATYCMSDMQYKKKPQIEVLNFKCCFVCLCSDTKKK